MDINEIRARLDGHPDAIYRQEIKWIKEDEYARKLKEKDQVVLARLKLRYDGTNAEREMKAKADQEYEKHIDEKEEAKTKALGEKALLSLLEKEWQSARTAKGLYDK